MATLSDLKARNIKPGDTAIADGKVTGLYLHAGAAKGHGKWILRFKSPSTAKRRDMGLGIYPEVGIADARSAALAARELIRDGQDPIEVRKQDSVTRQRDAQALTFEKAARKVHTDLIPGWKNPKHAAQWLTTLETYVFPRIGTLKVKNLKAGDFADALRPIWLKKPETASRVKQRCHAVMEWCVAQELIGANPVGSVVKLLSKQPGNRERVAHQPAMPWRDIPDFVSNVLHAGESNVTRALLEFLILTVPRSSEARGMTWDEVDLGAKVWTIPASRMKAKVAQRIPLADRAIEILKSQRTLNPEADLVFPSPRGKVLSDMVLTKFLRDQKAHSSDPDRTATAHGFRSSFRDWASENGYARDLAERALAHTVRNQVEAAYHRTDLLEQRLPMMVAWANHVGGKVKASKKVVSIRGRS